MTHNKPPREGHVRVAGIPWLARMIDKARLDAAGQIDQYDLEYPCPMDMSLLSQFGLSGEVFQQIAVNADSDEAVIEELKRRNAILT